jgi:hypothetical protein
MTNEQEPIEGGWREGVTLPARAGAWQVIAWWPPGARGGPQELRIVPARDADPQAVARGISTATLSAVPLTDLTAAYAEVAPSVDQVADWLSSVQQEANRKRNRSPWFYALVAAEYVALVEAGERQPVQVMAAQTGKSSEAVRGWIRTARTMGYLTGEPGRTTGELTERARELLSFEAREGGE